MNEPRTFISPSFKGISALNKMWSIVWESEGNRWCITVSGSSLVRASLINLSCCEENDNEKFKETTKSMLEVACHYRRLFIKSRVKGITRDI